jgi:CHAT domain-containing protein/Tfp pilus assembly protein PilF
LRAIERLGLHGDLAEAQKRAHLAGLRLSHHFPVWAWRFHLVEAQMLFLQGHNSESLAVLSQDPPPPSSTSDLTIQQSMLRAMIFARMGQMDQADAALRTAELALEQHPSKLMGEFYRARGVVDVEKDDLDHADKMFRQSLIFARQQNDRFLLASALLNVGVIALQREHYDQALAWSQQASDAAREIGASLIEERAEGNIAWADYQLGNFEEALDRFQSARKQAEILGSSYDRIEWLNDSGLALYRMGRLSEAEGCYQEAFRIAEKTKNQQEIIDAHISLSLLYLQIGNLESAARHTNAALALATSSGRTSDQEEAAFSKAMIEIHQGDTQTALRLLKNLDHGVALSPSLRWQVQLAFADVLDRMDQPLLADQYFRNAIFTFEAQRATLKREESKLPFSTNAKELYGEYIRFLVHHRRTEEALFWLDLGRARTLEEGLGIASPDFRSATQRSFQARDIARRLNATILVYRVSSPESYLWAITPSGIHFFRLPAEKEINAHIRKYQQAILESRDTLADAYAEGLDLYNILVAPAQKFIQKQSPVFIVPDGNLATFNFETLLAPGGGLHFWIEDAVITVASSLKLLSAFRPELHTHTPKKLLIVGDPISPDEKFPPLLNAGIEVGSIASHFPASAETVLTQRQAVPSAYLRSDPSQFAFIHFVAHGTSSSEQPLDSAIVLSRESSDPDSYKLYAREIVQHPLHADMVTISACYGSGSRIYGGEGLVGLSWAFLRAGAHYVVGSLWQTSDAAAPQLMDRLYQELAKGRPPDLALREAKLSLLHSQSIFRKPLYWATFQLYGGS